MLLWLTLIMIMMQMTSLRELDLSGNLLTELPLSLATLPALEVGEGDTQHSSCTQCADAHHLS